MTKRIFRSVCMTALSVFTITFVLIMGVLYSHFSTVQMNQLKMQTNLAARGVEASGSEYFDGLQMGSYRITWIDSDGTVLYDSASDPEKMENHLERKEVKEALKDGYGQSSRYSSTLMERYVYAAQRLSDGTVIRLSVAHSSVLLLLIGMIQPGLVIILVAVILSFVLAGRLSKRIVEPLNELNLDQPLENEEYDELAPLLHRIDRQQKQLRRQKEDLEHKQNELDVIVGNMEEGMVLLDQKGRVFSINKAAEWLLGAEESCVGSDLLTVSRNLELQQAVDKASKGESVSVKTSMRGKLIQISAAPIVSDRGTAGIAIVLFDITEKEQAEQKRREFTSNVSHELKTPLHAISGYLELIKCGMVKQDDIQTFTEKIYDETQRLIQLVEDIINLSHLDEGGKDMEKEELNLYAVADEVIQSLIPAAGKKQVNLTLEGENVSICGIPKLVHGIIYNLCDNGIKYNQEGGEVIVTVRKAETEAILTVKDTGIGIPKEEQERIFERFYRVDKGRSREVGGTGLGLSIVKHAVQIHNAVIDLYSREGEGTEVRVRFPV